MSEIHTRFTTIWILVVTTILLGAWDLYARRKPGGTISEVLLNSARSSPLIPFLFGVLMGHMFWFQEVCVK